MILIYNAQIVNEGTKFHGYVLIENDLIHDVCVGQPSIDLFKTCTEQYDLDGALLIPGAIDDHVHFREPGLTEKADIESESRAAIAGGVTSFMDMPNTKPATISNDLVTEKFAIAAQKSYANFSFYIGATNDNLDEILNADYTRVCGIKAFLGSSTGGMLLNDENVLRDLFLNAPSLVAVHCEDEDIINANKDKFLCIYDNGEVPVSCHPEIRSAEACYKSTAKAVKMAKECNTRLHVLHISTAAELDLFESGSNIESKKITAECCPSYLWWNKDDFELKGSRIKCNPAIKESHEGMNTLRQALLNGKIDVVGTDHAPHLLAQKQGGALKAASGMPSIQFALVTMLSMADAEGFAESIIVEKMCHAPAKLFNINKRGYIRKGFFADLAVIRKTPDYKITDADVVSKCGWTPFDGETVNYKVEKTFVNGSLVYDSGRFTGVKSAKALAFVR